MAMCSRGTQSTGQAMDRNGNLFFGLINPQAIACWDSSQAFYDANRIRVVVENRRTLQFSNGLKVVRNNQNREELWVLSNRLQVRGAISATSYQLKF